MQIELCSDASAFSPQKELQQLSARASELSKELPQAMDLTVNEETVQEGSDSSALANQAIWINHIYQFRRATTTWSTASSLCFITTYSRY